MENIQCFTCGVPVSSSTHYHFHNVSSHSVEQLSSTILKLLFQVEDPNFNTAGNDLYCNYSCDIGKNYVKKSTGTEKCNDGFLRECMDEVIELGPLEGADDLTVQSLFLKSNFAPNSRHVIEVEEKKHSQDVIKILSKELNAAVVNFQSDLLSARFTGTQSSIIQGKKILKPESRSVTTEKKTERRTKKRTSRLHRSENRIKVNVKTNVNENKNRASATVEGNSSKPNIKLVLRSGRTIKSHPRYEDFVYYDDIKELSQKNSDNRTNTDRGTVKRQVKCKLSTKTPQSSHDCFKGEEKQKEQSIGALSSKMFELFGDDFNLTDWSLNNELDISIEDLELAGFDDLEGILPENQILTVENLLQELDGGGSIEISNIIKENNIESDTVVLDALSQIGNSSVDSMHPSQAKNILPDSSNKKEDKVCKESSSFQNDNNRNYCTICCKQYVNRTHYLSHMEKYHIKCSKMLYKCATCEKVFYFLASFSKHMKEHNPCQTFICELCGRNFKSLVNLKIHFALHKKERTYQCDLCDKKYFLKYSYINHLKSHRFQDKLKCENCEKTFTQKSYLLAHLEKHRTGKYIGRSQDYKCTYCNDLKTLEELNAITKYGDNFITCFECKKGLYKKYLLRNLKYVGHNTTDAKDSSKKKHCQICGKYVLHLQKHIREVHLPVPVIECDICGQTVKKSSLKSHRHRLHSGLPAKCDHCEKVFKNSLALKEHLNKIRRSK